MIAIPLWKIAIPVWKIAIPVWKIAIPVWKNAIPVWKIAIPVWKNAIPVWEIAFLAWSNVFLEEWIVFIGCCFADSFGLVWRSVQVCERIGRMIEAWDGAPGIGEESPQRRFSGARTWNGKPNPPDFLGGRRPKERPKFQDPSSKFQEERTK